MVYEIPIFGITFIAANASNLFQSMKSFPAAAAMFILTLTPVLAQEPDSISQSTFPETMQIDILKLADTLEIKNISLADTFEIEIMDPEWDSSYFYEGDPEYNLLMSADRGQLKLVQMLVERGVSVDAYTSEGVTALMYAAQSGDFAMAKYLIENGAEPDEKPHNGITALTGAVRAGHYEMVELLLDAGASVDMKDYTNLTALMHASAFNYTRIVTLLVQHGANPEERDWFGTTPLMMAVYYNCYESSKELVRLEADINARDTFGFTSLMIAAQHGDYDLAWMLLDKGADPAIQNKSGQHALSMAVMNGHTDIIELLIENGANMNQRISPSTNAYDLAKEMEKEEMLAYLKEIGARPNKMPEFKGLRFGTSIGFNMNEVNYAVVTGVSENKYNSFATTGLVFRPTPVRILRPENDTLSYQYWEKRYAWPLTLGKQFRIYSLDGRDFGIRLQCTGALTWGSYRGSDRHPAVKYLFIPSAGLYWRKNFYGITFDYEYVPVKVQGLSPHKFRLGMEFYIDMRKRTRFTYKHIDWF